LSDEEPDEILVERALEEICNSDTFDGAPKRRQLLWYLVQAFLDKKKVDETSVAVEIYGRDPKEFNPKLDSIARVERGKLQKQLAKYFATEGDWLPIRIRLDGFLAIPEFKESTDDNSSKTHHAIPAPLPYKAFENVYVTQLHERRLRLPRRSRHACADSTPPSRDKAGPTSSKVVNSQSFCLTSDSRVASVPRCRL